MCTLLNESIWFCMVFKPLIILLFQIEKFSFPDSFLIIFIFLFVKANCFNNHNETLENDWFWTHWMCFKQHGYGWIFTSPFSNGLFITLLLLLLIWEYAPCVLFVYWMGLVNSRFSQDFLAYVNVCFKCGILFQGLVLPVSEEPVQQLHLPCFY